MGPLQVFARREAWDPSKYLQGEKRGPHMSIYKDKSCGSHLIICMASTHGPHLTICMDINGPFCMLPPCTNLVPTRYQPDIFLHYPLN